MTLINKNRICLPFKLLIISFLIHFVGYAQNPKIVITKGEAQVQWYPERESLTEARQRALELAKIDALENAFGTLISQGNVFYLENKKTGNRVETNSVFKTIGNTAVKGEIIEIQKEDYSQSVKKERVNRKKVKITYISCSLKIKAKELTDTNIEIESFALNSRKLLKPVTDFKQGQNLFLYFRSPQNGYLSVFLDDGEQAQCLLPYRNMPEGLEEEMPIKADKEYVFFSDYEEHNYFDDDFFSEDTYRLMASGSKDLNELYIVFSKEKLNRPILNKAKNKVDIDTQNYELPRVMNSDDFKKWIIKIKQIRNDLKVNIIKISIEK